MSMYDQKNSFVVGLDPAYILMCMTMWRDALDMKIPVHDSLKVHFMANRRGLLDGYVKTAHAWGMMLGASTMLAGDGHQAQLDELRAKVDEFKQWAKTGLAELNHAANDDALEDAMEEGFLELLRDPDERRRLQALIKTLPGSGPKNGQG